MKRWLMTACLAAAITPIVSAQAVPGQGVAGMNVDKVVEMELLTQSELADKIKNGWTSVLIVTGGTEIRGPHAVIGVHNTLATHRAVEAAKRLGKTTVAPTIPFAVSATGGFNANQWREFAEGSGATAPNPGAMQVDAATFKGIIQGAVESVLYIGFKDVFLMGDHGGGQNEMKAVSEEMSAKFAAKGIRVHYVGDFYQKTHDDIDMYMFNHKLPIAGHGGMMETAEMMYWEPTQYAFIRPIYKTVPFDGARFEGASLEADLKAWKDGKDRAAAARAGGAGAAPGAAAGAGAGGARGGGAAAGGGAGRGAGGGAAATTNPDGSPRVNNGLSGNPHFATKAIGKDLAEIGITNTVTQVKALLAAPMKAPAQTAAPANPRFGSWKMKPATPYADGDKSSNIMTYAPLPGGGMSVKIETTNKAGEPGTPWGYNTMLDGKDLPVYGRNGTDTASVTPLNDKINVIIYKQGGRLVQILQNVLSADGNTLNISYTSTDAKGETKTTYATYEKVVK